MYIWASPETGCLLLGKLCTHSENEVIPLPAQYTATVCQILSTQKPISPWNYKPWWCQPWSILLTGAVIITGSWVLLKTIWVTVLISMPILVWWAYFLLLWPELLRRSGILENYQQPTEDSIPSVRD
jgi:hypothetical protein